MTLEKKDQRLIEKYFDMSTGYVLQYSNRTFSDLFKQFDVEIYEDRYSEYGGSKAKRLRSFFEQHDNALIGKIVLEIIDEHDAVRDSHPLEYKHHNHELRQKCIEIGNKLKNSNTTQPPSSTTSSQPFTNPFKQQPICQTPSQQVQQTQQPMTQSIFQQPIQKEKVFIVHGHNDLVLTETENLCRKLDLEPVFLKNSTVVVTRSLKS